MEEGRQPRSSWTKGLAAMISSSVNSAPDFSRPPNATGTNSQTKNFMLDFQQFVYIFRCALHLHSLQSKGHWHINMEMCARRAAPVCPEKPPQLTTGGFSGLWLQPRCSTTRSSQYTRARERPVGANWRPTLLLREDCLKNLYMIVYLPFVCSGCLSCKNSLHT